MNNKNNTRLPIQASTANLSDGFGTAFKTIASIAALLNDYKQLDTEEYLVQRFIRDACVKAIGLIDSELSVGTNRGSFSREPSDIHSLLESNVTLMMPRALEKEQLILLVSENIILNINRLRIWGVINNLIENAITFSPWGETITVELARTGQSAVISVKDNGIGMSAGLKAKKINDYIQTVKPEKSYELSLAFGLAASIQIIEAHNGKIWFESEDAEGTRFCIELPLCDL